MHLKTFLLLLLLMSCYLLPAQLFGSRTDTSGLVWKIRFHLDASLQPLYSAIQDKYEGEYLVQASPPIWKWASWDSTRKAMHRKPIPAGERFPKFFRYYSLQLGTSLNLYKGLYLGFNYTPIFSTEFIPVKDINGNIGYYNQNALALIGLGTSISYDFPIHKRISLQPSFSLGGYMDPFQNYYEGVGQEWFKEARLAVAFRPFKRDELRVWAAWNNYSYNEKYASEIYPEKNRVVHTSLTSIFLGVGYALNIYILEDAIKDKKRKKLIAK